MCVCSTRIKISLNKITFVGIGQISNKKQKWQAVLAMDDRYFHSALMYVSFLSFYAHKRQKTYIHILKHNENIYHP